MKLFMLFLLASGMVYPQYPSQTIQSYTMDIDRWHAERERNLTREHGWLSLIALEWLNAGENTIHNVGSLFVYEDSLILRLSSGISGLRNKKKFTSGRISADVDKIFFGTKALSVIKRDERFAVRIWDSETPARKNFTGIARYPVTTEWKIEARWMPYDIPKKVDIATVIPDLTQHGTAPGIAIFSVNGKEFQLEPTLEEGSEDYFFVFGDKTNGKETYGAGRFLYAEAPKNGRITLDFNKAYNPPCVFTNFATCPIPSRGNILSVRIEAGEKNYRIHK